MELTLLKTMTSQIKIKQGWIKAMADYLVILVKNKLNHLPSTRTKQKSNYKGHQIDQTKLIWFHLILTKL